MGAAASKSIEERIRERAAAAHRPTLLEKLTTTYAGWAGVIAMAVALAMAVAQLRRRKKALAPMAEDSGATPPTAEEATLASKKPNVASLAPVAEDCAAATAEDALARLADWPAAGALTFSALGTDDRQLVRLAALKRGLTVRSRSRAGARILVVKPAEAEAAAAVAEEATVDAAADAALPANLFVWVVLSSCSRMLTHLATARQLPCRVEVLRGEGAVQQFRYKRNNGSALLAARCDSVADAATVAAALVADDILAYPLRKAFVVEEATHATFDGAAAALVAALDAAAAAAAATDGAGGGSRTTVRLQVWPKTLMARLLGSLPAEPALWELSPQATGGLVGSVVRLASGVFKVGASGADCYAGNVEMRNHGEAAGGIDSQICRAFYKLREAVQVAQVDEQFSFAGAVAVDAGAAPGGWTKYLASDRGCSRVYAVDPGDLDVSLLSTQGNVRHVRSLVQEALPVIVSELAAEGKVLDIFVTDLCPHHPREMQDILQPLLRDGMLRPGGLVVVTFKFGQGHTEAAFDKQAAEQVAQLDGLLQKGRTTLVHLMANRLRERTLIGYAASHGASPPPPSVE
jgi:hypothetical protein